MDRRKHRQTTDKQAQFIEAVKNKNAKEVQKLLTSQCISINKVHNGANALDIAIENHDIATVEILLSHPDIQIKRQSHHVSTPLTRAMEISQYTPLYLRRAANQTMTKILALLLQHPKADINEEVVPGHQDKGVFFNSACYRGQTDVVALLLSDTFKTRGVKTHGKDSKGDTASHDTCSSGHVPILKLLLENKCFQAWEQNAKQQLPLHKACEDGQLNIVKFMLNNFKSVFGIGIGENQSQAILFDGAYIAAEVGHIDVVYEIFKHVMVHSIDGFHWSRLVLSTIKMSGAQTKVLVLNTYTLVTNPSVYSLVQEIFRVHFWSTFGDVTRAAYALWKITFHMTWAFWLLWENRNRIYTASADEVRSHQADLQERLFRAMLSNVKHAAYALKLDPNQDPRLHLLYHAVKYGIPDLVALIVAHTSDLSIYEPVLGIAIGNLATKKGDDIRACLAPLKNKEPARAIANQSEEKEFTEWYRLLKWASSSIDRLPIHLPVAIERLDAVMVLIFQTHKETVLDTFDIIRERMYSETDEKKLVFETMRSFMKELSAEVAKMNPLHQFDPVQVGSSREGTRPYRPDEFDFLLVCRAVLKHLKISTIEVPSRVVIKIARKAKKAIREGLGTPDGYFDFPRYKVELLGNIISVIKTLFANGRSYGRYLWVEPQYLDLKTIPCLHLRWRGNVYKDMEITVDLVPALELSNFTPNPKLVDESCTYYAFVKQREFTKNSERILFPIAYSEAEVTLIRQLPECARQGFQLAKAMRIAVLFPDLIQQLLQGVFAIDECLKTYMLKTAVLVLAKVVPTALQSRLTQEQWAFMVYCYLVYRVRDNGSLMNIFDADHIHKQFSIFACRHELDIAHGEEARACCINRRNLLVIVQFMLHVLKAHLEREGRNVPSMDELAQIPKLAANNHPGRWFWMTTREIEAIHCAIMTFNG